MTTLTSSCPISRRSLRHFQVALWLGAVTGAALLLIAPKAHALSQAQEIALGRRISREAVKMFGATLPASSPLSQRVARIGKRFAMLSGRKGIPFSYRVLNNRKVLNAFAAPGGSVFITRRLVEFTRSDAELAAVLAHETSHIEHRDAARHIEGREAAHRSMMANLARSGVSREDARYLDAVNDLSYDIESLDNSCDDEAAADATGVRWMALLGYDPNAMLTLFARMYQEEQKTGSEPYYLRTHPPTANRFANIQAQIASENLIAIAQAKGGARLLDIVQQHEAAVKHAAQAKEAQAKAKKRHR